MATLASLRTLIRQRIDRVNSQFVTDAELNSYINYSCGALYNELVSVNQDYNVIRQSFTLSGNADGYNLLNMTTLTPGVMKVRNVEVYAPNASADPWVSIRQCPSQFEKHAYARTLIDPLLGIPLVSYLAWGQELEILPCVASAGTYRLTYVPIFGPLVNDSDSIDGYYMSVNGWDEYVILDCAIKCLAKEESDPSIYMAQLQNVRALIIKSATPRDAGQPQQIVDIHHNGFTWGMGGGWDGWG